MRIEIKSDLHQEFIDEEEFNAKDFQIESLISLNETPDVLVLAGDITNYLTRFRLYYQLTKLDHLGIPVIYVLGNHEYYRSPNARNVVKEFKHMYEGTNVHVLDRDVFDYQGVRFVGATLWSDISSETEVRMALRSLADFRIPGLSINWYNEENKKSKEYIRHILSQSKNEKVVVVTHHTPSFKSCSERYAGDSLNCCFHNDMDDDILNYEPELWIHGHTHDPMDYTLGGTRVICNPKGYPNENVPSNFVRDLVVEI